MHHFFLILLLLISLLPHETSYSAAAASGGGDLCRRRCGGTTVPYPFGFSPGCPIALSCDASTSTPILPYGVGDNDTSYRFIAFKYIVVAFNSTTSTVLVVFLPSCSRSVSDARRALSGRNYDVSNRTGMFLHGRCRDINASLDTGCSLSPDLVSRVLHMVQCADNSNGTSATTMVCVASDTGKAAADLFLRWEKVEKQQCEAVLASAVLADTAEGLEFGVAELRWWVNGTCADREAGGRCTANARCSDVISPSGAVGHRCACMAGMMGDGFLAGDGCSVARRDKDGCAFILKAEKKRIGFL